ncbi:uncharacterized protein PV07_04782 [Cladophialophora immunda]|uniref:Transcription factor domain-containing protein n=1 Tax=Cladophialophora immunda TaxID=569365 RepID=A0A0D2CFC1_9EURO|nr:uncharacterized protein PV07_04782 [Cladophialophora immunda]KIW28930.1 hypothetical protein PV07_04782 [Cladophialophora immunda]
MQTTEQAMLLHAVYFAAFGHLNDSQLRQSPFQSIVEGQTSLFRMVQSMYHFHSQARPSDTLILAQVAVLLSFWSPYDSSVEVNSFWAAEAIRHSLQSGPFDAPAPTSGQKRMVMWCSLVRNRTIVLGLRRPRLLFDAVDPGRLPEPEDFRYSLTASSSSSVSSWKKSDRCAAAAFIFLCQLSRIMAAIIKSRTAVQWVPWWQDSLGMGQFSRVGHAMELERRLNAWDQEFERCYHAQGVHWVGDEDYAYLHILSIMHMGTRVALWEDQLLSWSLSKANTTSQMLCDLAFLKMIEISSEIAQLVQVVTDQIRGEFLPPTLLAWLIVPIATQLLKANNSQRQDVIFENDPERSKPNAMVRTLGLLKPRFQGAGFVAEMIENLYDAFLHPLATSRSLQRRNHQHQYDYHEEDTGLCSRLVSPNPHEGNEAEPQLLARIVRFIQRGLSMEIVHFVAWNQ